MVTIGVLSNADGVLLAERFLVYLFDVSNLLVPLNNMPEGIHPPPVRTDIGVRNNTPDPRLLEVVALCLLLPGVQSNIGAALVFAGAPHAAFSPVPDGWRLIGNSFTVSGSSRNRVTLWDDQGRVSSVPGYVAPDATATTLGTIRGVYLEGVGDSPSGAKQQMVGRAIVGSLVVPTGAPVPAPTIVTIVEFYHSGLDHYFITANPKEIAELDGGVHAGWQRTGESFSAYGVGSSGRAGRRPVCRAYGNPAAGLDSHFYSASPNKCLATLENFGNAWLFEAAVFEMELPDTTTGACSSDRTPVYRLWNNRVDSSHRFVKSLALRAQMIARDFISEGYGPNGRVLCAALTRSNRRRPLAWRSNRGAVPGFPCPFDEVFAPLAMLRTGRENLVLGTCAAEIDNWP